MVSLLLSLALVTPGTAAAARKTGADPDVRVRMALVGQTLTVDIAPGAAPPDRSLVRMVAGRRLDFVCGTSFRSRRGLIHMVRTWPRGRDRFSVMFMRDLSRRARWCLVERGGGDIAFVSFLRAERPRVLAKGRGATGDWWRVSGWRGRQDEPCVGLRIREGPTSHQCFDHDAAREATLGVLVAKLRCPGETFVYGATSRAAAAVHVRIADGTTVAARLLPRPTRSRVRARFFLAVLPPRAPRPVSVRAIAATGRTIDVREFEIVICGGSVGD
jgi:hypothetical protein